MSEPHIKKAWLWKRPPKLYPNACACIGLKLGYFHGRTWWHAIGEAQEIFRLATPDLLEELRTSLTDSCSSIVYFQLYMIGHSERSAIPTIMFFCSDEESRKKARKAIDDGGILTKLPGFRTEHRAKQPNIGPLIQSATENATVEERNPHEATLDVYFDPSRPLQALGMPIFVKSSDGHLRQATANAFFKGQTCVFLSVSHILLGGSAPMHKGSLQTDSDFDFGSGTESEIDDYCLDITSRASMSSAEDGMEDQTESSSSESGSSIRIHKTTLINPVQPDSQNESTVELVNAKSTQPKTANFSAKSSSPLIESLEYLGYVAQTSSELDGALILIRNLGVLSFVRTVISNIRKEDFLKSTNIQDHDGITQVLALASHGPISGFLPNISTYMQLPGSTTFQKVFEVTLNALLDWEDRGTVVLDAETAQPYGHVVAISTSKLTAFVIPSAQVFEELDIQWNVPETYDQEKKIGFMGDLSRRFKECSTSSSFPENRITTGLPLSRKRELPRETESESSPDTSFTFITGSTPAELKSKRNMDTVRRKALQSFFRESKRLKSNTTASAQLNTVPPAQAYSVHPNLTLPSTSSVAARNFFSGKSTLFCGLPGCVAEFTGQHQRTSFRHHRKQAHGPEKGP